MTIALTIIVVWLALQLPLGMLIGTHFELAWRAVDRVADWRSPSFEHGFA
jgi:hypothetical protein